MNKERILALADRIETLPHKNSEAGGFTMTSYVKYGECKTPACIAGWAVHEFDERGWEEASDRIGGFLWPDIAMELLDLPPEKADELFHPVCVPWPDITPAQAAKCLRHLASTGEVDWEWACDVGVPT